MKLKETFYEDFFKQTVENFYKYGTEKRFKKYRLLACDTTVQKLPDTEENRRFGVHKNQFKAVASIKILTYFDVLNSMINHAFFHDKRRSDIRCAQGVISTLNSDSISIYDRGFSGHIIPFLHGHYGSKYVIRQVVGQSNACKEFMKSDLMECIIVERIQEKALKELKKMGIPCSSYDTLRYRLVKVILATGEVEVLKTNLEQDVTIESLNMLYGLRWGIETSYNYIKNTFMLGTFSGYSTLAVKQDIWCVLIAFNLQSILLYDCQEELETVNNRRKETYQINRNVGAGTIRNKIKSLFSTHKKTLLDCLEYLKKTLLKSLEKVKDCKKERQRKRMRINDRHQTEMNYKRGF